MKLRLRNVETKETLRLQIASPCTLQQLQQTLSQTLSLPPPSSSLYFSLNRKDALHASSSHDSLSSLGITSGDLIYFSLNPTSLASSQTPITQIQETPVQDLTVQKEETEIYVDTNLDSNTHIVESQEKQEMEETQVFSDAETMDFDDGSGDVTEKRLSEPYFLRRVLRNELGDDGTDHKLLVISVHAVLLESGFIGFDSVTGLRVDRFHLPDEWSSIAFTTVSLWYTLPELLGNLNECVVLKFQSLGHFVNVYGSLGKGGSSLYRVCLDQYRFAPTIDLVWANCDKNDKMDDNDGSLNSYPENEVFEFWKIVKDGLALPLLIELCDKTGLALPACLMRLPTELKVKILESLPAVDVAKMGCVCSEMRYLSSNNDLWKQKFAEEFGDGAGAPLMNNWKDRFAYSWESRKKRKRVVTPWHGFHPGIPIYIPIRRDPVPFGGPPMMIGGDYDRLPGLGNPSPFGQRGRLFPRRQNFSPPCNLGGFNF